MKKQLQLFLLAAAFLISACQEVEIDGTIIQEGEPILLDDSQSTEFSIFEIVTLDLGDGTFTNGQLEAMTLEGDKIPIIIQDGILTFMVPKLNQGENKLVFTERIKPFHIPFKFKVHDFEKLHASADLGKPFKIQRDADGSWSSPTDIELQLAETFGKKYVLITDFHSYSDAQDKYNQFKSKIRFNLRMAVLAGKYSLEQIYTARNLKVIIIYCNVRKFVKVTFDFFKKMKSINCSFDFKYFLS